MIDRPAGQDRPPFVIQKAFIETPFEQRFQGAVRNVWENRSWQVITAVPGSGKSMGLADLLLGSGAYKEHNVRTYIPVLVIRAPKNNAGEQALGIALSKAMGWIVTMPWNVRRILLPEEMASVSVECIIIDDAHDLTDVHLRLIKELTDNLAAPPHLRQVGLGLVAAHGGDVVPLKQVITTPVTLWQQFYNRMDTEHPFRAIDGHTLAEVRDILTAFEDLYHSQLPNLHLRIWAKEIYGWLTNPILDLDRTQRVTMGHLTRLVTSALRRAYNQGETDVSGQILQETADLMIYRRDELFHIGGDSTDEEQPPAQEVG
jgi:hypothetical protein